MCAAGHGIEVVGCMTAPTVAMKRCPRCGETKSVDGFNRNRSKRDGLDAQCKACRRTYREDHREEIRSYNLAYHEANREERCSKQRAYNEAHREEKVAYQRAYDRDRRALLGDPWGERWQEITAKHATRRGRWSEAEDAYLAASTDRTVDDALALKRTHRSVENRIARLRKRGVALARDVHRR